MCIRAGLYIALASGCGPGKTKHWRRRALGWRAVAQSSHRTLLLQNVCGTSVCMRVFNRGAHPDRWGTNKSGPVIDMLTFGFPFHLVSITMPWICVRVFKILWVVFSMWQWGAKASELHGSGYGLEPKEPGLLSVTTAAVWVQLGVPGESRPALDI